MHSCRANVEQKQQSVKLEHRHCCAAHQSGRKYRVTKEGISRLTNYDAATRSLSFEGDQIIMLEDIWHWNESIETRRLLASIYINKLMKIKRN